MKQKMLRVTIALFAITAGIERVAAQGTAFTYQGRLTDGTNPVTGNYDLRFILRDGPTTAATTEFMN